LADVISIGFGGGWRSTLDASPMSHSTTAPRAGQSSLFAPGGLQWVAMPVMPPGPAQVILAAILQKTRKKTVLWAPDRELAELAGCSLRLVQKGLAALEAMGWIERHRWRGARKITLLIRLAGQCTHSHDDATSTRTAALHPLARPGTPLKSSGKREESAATPALPGDSRSVVTSEEPSPAMLRFFPRFLPPAPENSCGRVAELPDLG
jgi:hypothetical protein